MDPIAIQLLWKEIKGSKLDLGFLVISLLAVLGTIFSFFAVGGDKGKIEALTRHDSAYIAKIKKEFDQLNTMQTSFSAIEVEIKSIREKINEITSLPKEGKINLKISEIDKALTSFKKRQDDIESVILANPKKALTLPLLEREIEIIKNNYDNDRSAIKTEIDRIYSLFQWFIGLMFTIAIGVLGLAGANVFRSKEKKAV
jgi:septal ring factor EnvC (AmiA/AmiB activator)